MRSCEFEIDDNLDGEDDKEETKKVADIRVFHFSVEIVIDKVFHEIGFQEIVLTTAYHILDKENSN